MASTPGSSSSPTPTRPTAAPAAAIAPRDHADPRAAYRLALSRYPTSRLRAMVQLRGLDTEAARSSTLATELAVQVDTPSTLAALIARISPGARTALSLFALAEVWAVPLTGLGQSLRILGIDPAPAVRELIEPGLLAVDLGEPADPEAEIDLAGLVDQPSLAPGSFVLVHPSVSRAVRPAPPRGELVHVSGTVGQIRESDGLEPIIRLGALWQRAGVEPLRQTQQGALYKRDRERIEEDPVLAGTIHDSLEPTAELPAFWLSLARRIGLIVADASGERLEAAAAEFWSENAFHLTQMIATGWLGLSGGWDAAGAGDSRAGASLSATFARPALLLWLATLADNQWVAIDDFAEHLRTLAPGWDQPDVPDDPTDNQGRRVGGGRGKPGARLPLAGRGLERLLLASAYALGLVRAAEETVSRRRLVQLTPLGRYVLTLGPPPPPRPAFDHFLFVQPNFEMIAYRQGLNTQLVGRLSRFAWWTKIGAALELRLTQESIAFGLEGGLSTVQMLELLTRHSQRPLPGGVTDAVGRWADRRDRVTFYAATTLIEFGSTFERDQALAGWEQGERTIFIPVGDRFLLAEDPQGIPTDRIRTSGSRDYRHPPEKCVAVGADGITLILDASRSDLLIDAELTQFANELTAPRGQRSGEPGPPPRRFLVSTESLARAIDRGMTHSQLAEWFTRRTGNPIPPAIRLLLRAGSPQSGRLRAHRLLVLTMPDPDLLDGLIQHPETGSLLGDRLGPTTVVIADHQLAALEEVVQRLGLQLDTD